MEGYKPIFDAAENASTRIDYQSIFPAFHDYHDLFHFIIAPASQQHPDSGALELAQSLNPIIFERLLGKGPSRVGNGCDTLDGVESRHILLMTYLIGALGTDWGSVVEIGGGYGNCLRLISGTISYDIWYIIDMPYILELQKWFLAESKVDTSNVYFKPTDKVLVSIGRPNLVIGTHSLSEFSLDDFVSYYTYVIKNSKWFFYVSQDVNPDKDLLQAKLALIQENFITHDSMKYEGGTSIMYLFRNKEE